MDPSLVTMNVCSYWTSERTREVITIVRSNVGIYAKGARMFKDKQAKDLAWQCVGAMLNPSCSDCPPRMRGIYNQISVIQIGDIVAKRFKHLRDTFQKERKKVLANMPSSGAGVQDGNARYESTWEYYNDLLFLSEHINSRTTVSNYGVHSDSESACPETQSDDSQFSTNEADSCTNVLKRKASQPLIEIIQENQKATTENIEAIVPSVSLQCMSSSDNESLFSSELNIISCESSVPNIEVQTLPTKMSAPQYEASLREKSLTIRGKAVKSILQHKNPISDVTKKEKNEDIIKNCIQQLSRSAAEVAEKITRPTGTNNNIDELHFLQYLIKHIPDDKKLLCMSDFCRVAKIYRKGASPNITEAI